MVAEDAAERAAAAAATAAVEGGVGKGAATPCPGKGEKERSVPCRLAAEGAAAAAARCGGGNVAAIADVNAADLRALAGAIDSARSVRAVSALIRGNGSDGGAGLRAVGNIGGAASGGAVGRSKLLLRSEGSGGGASVSGGGVAAMPPTPSDVDDDSSIGSGDGGGNGGGGGGTRSGRGRGSIGAATRVATTFGRAMGAAAVSAGKRAIERVMSGGEEMSQDEAHELLYELFDSSTAAAATTHHHGNAIAAEVVDCYSDSARLPPGSSLAADVAGAPAGGLLAGVAAAMASMPSTSDMARLYVEVLHELTWHWENCQPIPRVPPRDVPDVRCCLMHQQLQLLNCCIARRSSREAAAAVVIAPTENGRNGNDEGA